MKLSKAQQEVVDKMREGWVLKRLHYKWYLSSVSSINYMKVSDQTINKLTGLGVIECQEQNAIRNTADIYRLTEHHKNQQK